MLLYYKDEVTERRSRPIIGWLTLTLLYNFPHIICAPTLCAVTALILLKVRISKPQTASSTEGTSLQFPFILFLNLNFLVL